MNISTLQQEDSNNVTNSTDSFHEQQLRNSTLNPIMSYLSEGILQVVAKLIIQALLYKMEPRITSARRVTVLHE